MIQCIDLKIVYSTSNIILLCDCKWYKMVQRFQIVRTQYIKVHNYLYLKISNIIIYWSHNNSFRFQTCSSTSNTSNVVKKMFNMIIIYLVYFQDKKWMFCCYHSLFRLLSVTIYYNYLRCLWLWNIRKYASIHYWQPKKQPIEDPNAQKGK